MKKALIYGLGPTGIQSLWHLSLEYEILGFVVSDERRIQTGGGIEYNGKTYTIYLPKQIANLDFDKVFIATVVEHYIDEIKQILCEIGVDEKKIEVSVFSYVAKYARLNFIKITALMQEEKKISANVAELGVWKGETARYINAYFPQSEFYLLDTFEGFCEEDIKKEQSLNTKAKASNSNDFSDTSIEFVKQHLPNLQKCHFIKGYFPDSINQMPQDLNFSFVNIDVDLYQPILAGLEYFYPRMLKGGVILIHDYFHPYYTGTKQAVDEFCEKEKLKCLPIGDGFSVAINKI